MEKPTIILATSNGVGMGHLARASAVAQSLKGVANPIIVSMAGAIAEIPQYMGIRCEYIPGRDRMWMSRDDWDIYLRDRLLALIEETGASVLSFDGVVPYPGVIAAKFHHPELSLVWVRRGFWQKKPQRFVLGLQSKMMDHIIEPGDFARAYDKGPTSKRRDAKLTSPVSLFNPVLAHSRDEARSILNLDPVHPAVLVQLGTGENDANEKMTAALKGLVGWKDLQIVLTKEPKDKNGKSLVPDGLNVSVIRHFPLARVLHAFDAAICATGYNGVHELLPAKVPTVFVSNIRGTDDQEARARWCHDNGYAIRADQSNLEEITSCVSRLHDEEVRNALSTKCAELPALNGGMEIGGILLNLAKEKRCVKPSAIKYRQLQIQDHLNRGLKHVIYLALRNLSKMYRTVRPYPQLEKLLAESPVWGCHTSPDDLRPLISGSRRFEHLIPDASIQYIMRRQKIAEAAYLKRGA